MSDKGAAESDQEMRKNSPHEPEEVSAGERAAAFDYVEQLNAEADDEARDRD